MKRAREEIVIDAEKDADKEEIVDAEALLRAMKDVPNDEQNLSLKELTAVMSLFKQKWLSESKFDFKDATMNAARRFDCMIDEKLSLADLVFVERFETAHIEKAYRRELFAWIQLQYHFRKQNLLDGGVSRHAIQVDDHETDDLAQDFKKIAETMLSSRALLHAHKNYLKALDPQIDSGAPTSLDPFQYMPFDPLAKNNPYQELLLFVLLQMKDRGYKKFRGTCWRSIMTEFIEVDGERKRFATLAWEPATDEQNYPIDMEKFILMVIKKEDHFKQWQNLTTNGMTNLRNLADYLKSSNEEEFMTLRPDRDYISFKNGILDLRGHAKKGPIFHPFPIKTAMRKSNVVAHNFINKNFGSGKDGACVGWPSLQNLIECGDMQECGKRNTDPTFYKDPRQAKEFINWESIFLALNDSETYENFSTNAFNNIFFSQFEDDKEKEAKTQYWNQAFKRELKERAEHSRPDEYIHRFKGLPVDAWEPAYYDKLFLNEFSHIIFWHYVLLGRLLYKTGEKDSWQVIQFFKGVAGCGKSTILNLAGMFFRPEDTETLGNQARGGGKAIGVLENLYDKYLWKCYEVKDDFSLSQSHFQSMVSGEIVPIDRLHKVTISVTWDVPGILAGNDFGGWKDNSGSISRRVIVSNFAASIEESVKDPTLPAKLEAELPAIIHKCNLAYHYATLMYKECDIWNVLPQYFKWTREKLSAASDPLAGFLNDPTCGFANDKTSAVSLDLLLSRFKEYAEKENLPPSVRRKIARDEEKIKPSLANFGLQYLRAREDNRAKIERALGEDLPPDWKKKEFVAVMGLKNNNL